MCWALMGGAWAQTRDTAFQNNHVSAAVEAAPRQSQSQSRSAAKAASAATASMTPPTVTRVFPLAEVRRGLRGVAYTVFEGVNPGPMQVEMLGVLREALGPGQDMILARLRGEKPEYTGVVAGMSGSPVYIDGRLVGALSYRIGQFSKDPIAGITPIEYMLAVRDGEVRPAGAGGLKRAWVSEGHGQVAVVGMQTSLGCRGVRQGAGVRV